MKKRLISYYGPDGRAADAILGLLFPRRCPVCEKIVVPGGRLICPDCEQKLSPVRPPRCLKCGKEIAAEDREYCQDCSRHPRSFEWGAALFNYNEAASRSMARIKYSGRREYLDFYAKAMAQRLGPALTRMKAQVLVPVPVHPSRLRERGFNQAAELAWRLGELLGLSVDDELLVREKKTARQKDLGPAQRLANLQQAFSVPEKRRRAGYIPEAVILTDDIYTTGSTIEACTRVLKAAGVKRVYFAAVCIGGER
mgnify:CR=1 FL=1